MANEGRRGGFGGRGRSEDRGRSSFDERGGRGGGAGRGGGRFSGPDRDRSPVRDERMREPYIDSFRGGGSGAGPRGPFPVVGDFGPRDPYFPEPGARRGAFPPDPWIDDPYRRDPYADPYRDPPYRIRPPPPPECEIFVQTPQLRTYGEIVERRVRDHSLITGLSVLPEGRTPLQLAEDVTLNGGLFAIFINAQNEMHRSLTLNILHGTPQEHRNMPLEDAVALVGRSFHQYVDGLREKASVISPSAAPSSRIFLPPSSEVVYLLNLLADNRAVTMAELNTVIKYLEQRREKMLDAESRPLITDAESYGKNPQVQAPRADMPQQQAASGQESVVPSSSKEATSVHQELTSKILSLFTSTSGGVQGVPPANGTQQSSPSKLSSGTPAPTSLPQASVASGASLINFDNPNVQKALDNLIQSTPSLLKNINAKTSLSLPQANTPSVSTSTAGSMNMSSAYFGQGGGGGGGMATGQGQMQPQQNNPQSGMQGAGFVGLPGQWGMGQGIQMPGVLPALQNLFNLSGQGQGQMGRGFGQQPRF